MLMASVCNSEIIKVKDVNDRISSRAYPVCGLINLHKKS